MSTEFLERDLRAYFGVDREYLRSGGNAAICKARLELRHACFGDLPWGISITEFAWLMDNMPSSWSIDSKAEKCVNWVKEKFNKKQQTTIVY